MACIINVSLVEECRLALPWQDAKCSFTEDSLGATVHLWVSVYQWVYHTSMHVIRLIVILRGCDGYYHCAGQ